MYILILFLPLLSAIISGLFGRKVGIKGSQLFSSACIIISFLISCFIYYESVLNSSTTYISLWRWFDIGLFTSLIGFQYDSLTATMLIVITSISAVVHIYSIGYMEGDPHIPRFMSYLSLFTFLMIVLVTSDNYLQLFIGWEGVGLCSYLLINFWFSRLMANKAAIKAMLMNRVGDLGLIIAIILIFREFGSLEFSVIVTLISLIEKKYLIIICLLLFLGAIGKSAQLGLHTWLPDAMEGPTPVSALIHAATMVTAGVYLVIRSGPLFDFTLVTLIIITIFGALTAFFAATVGVVQNDLKKIIAYSTCSQLGYMIMICGLSAYSVSLFHLTNHAFFKALLFLSAGSVIHAVNNEQDIRKMGALIKSIPYSYTMILVGSMSLAGFPYLAGFYSKDLILEFAYEKFYIIFAYWLASLTAFLTAFYSIRLIYLVFIANINSTKQVAYYYKEDNKLAAPLFPLAIGSICLGYIGKSIFLSSTLMPVLPNYIKLMPIILSFSGAIIAYYLYYINWRVYIGAIFPKTFSFFNSAWQFNYIINHFFVYYIWKIGHLITYRLIDRGLLEIVGPKGISLIIIRATQFISILQSGSLVTYILIFIVFVIFFLLGIYIKE